MKFPVLKILACCVAVTCADAGSPRAEFGAQFAAAEKAKLDSLTPFKEELIKYAGQGKWVYEMAEKMKE